MGEGFFFGEFFQGTIRGHLFQLFEAADGLADGLEVGQGAAQPALIDEIAATATGFLLHRFARLAFGAHKEHAAMAARELFHKIEGFPEHGEGMFEIDNMNAVAFTKEVRRHFGVPVARLVTKMNAGLQQGTHGNIVTHGLDSPCWVVDRHLSHVNHPCGHPAPCADKCVDLSTEAQRFIAKNDAPGNDRKGLLPPLVRFAPPQDEDDQHDDGQEQHLR